MRIEKLESKYINPSKLNDDEILKQVNKCFASKEWILTGDTLVLYSEKGLPDAVRVITIEKITTYVDRDSETWKERGIPRKSPEEMKILKAQLYEAIKNGR